jgi:GTP pyrophosphokinase
MRSLDGPAEDRKRFAQECLDIYAPLADRLGISWIKDELEDLALKNLNREVFYQIRDIVALKKGERQKYLDTVKDRIEVETAALGIRIEVESRAKHFYSIFQKMRRRDKGLDNLYDLFGVRILCDSIENCYTLLGMVHRLWKPLEGRFKDYIAMPKSNGYQSLHTTVMVSGDFVALYAENREADSPEPPEIVPGKPFPWSPLTAKIGEGMPLEIQIRTFDMHQMAEHGIASHWLYKKGSAKELVRPADLPLINRLKDWKQRETENSERNNSESFLEDIKRELLKDSIYVFTPQGKVVELPTGATPIDFAYHIHSAIGDHCVGAKADGAIIPLSAPLQNTQVVEILTATNARPHFNWLRIVKTAKARSKIRSWLLQNDSSGITDKSVAAKVKQPPQAVARDIQDQGEETVQRVISPQPLDNLLRIRVNSDQGPLEKNLMIRFAKCCHPIIGDDIVGYVSRGRGITIHRRNCGNLINIPDFAERCIKTEWENNTSLLVKRFKVEARRSADLFSEIEGAIRKYQGHLIEGRLDETRVNHMSGFFTMQIEEPGSLKKILKGIRGIPSVYSILTLN